jgi:peptide/nickel transport system substrate-binding protein
MRSLGYGPDNRLNVKVSTRNIAWYLDHATILIDQLKEIWIDGELDAVETANWVPKLLRKDFTVAQSLSGSAVDDPDTQFTRTIPAARHAITPAATPRSMR